MEVWKSESVKLKELIIITIDMWLGSVGSLNRFQFKRGIMFPE